MKLISITSMLVGMSCFGQVNRSDRNSYPTNYKPSVGLKSNSIYNTDTYCSNLTQRITVLHTQIGVLLERQRDLLYLKESKIRLNQPHVIEDRDMKLVANSIDVLSREVTKLCDLRNIRWIEIKKR